MKYDPTALDMNICQLENVGVLLVSWFSIQFQSWVLWFLPWALDFDLEFLRFCPESSWLSPVSKQTLFISATHRGKNKHVWWSNRFCPESSWLSPVCISQFFSRTSNLNPDFPDFDYRFPFFGRNFLIYTWFYKLWSVHVIFLMRIKFFHYQTRPKVNKFKLYTLF